MSERRFMQFRHMTTGEIAGRFEVTGKSEREIDRIERGMLRNCHDDWLVDDVTEPALKSLPL
jgi:hypothetical protein